MTFAYAANLLVSTSLIGAASGLTYSYSEKPSLIKNEGETTTNKVKDLSKTPLNKLPHVVGATVNRVVADLKNNPALLNNVVLSSSVFAVAKIATNTLEAAVNLPQDSILAAAVIASGVAAFAHKQA